MPTLAELGLDGDESELGQELAVLEAIYPETDFLSPTELELRIEIEEDPAEAVDQAASSEQVQQEDEAVLGGQAPFVTLRFELPETYPATTPPAVSVRALSPAAGLSGQPGDGAAGAEPAGSFLDRLRAAAAETHSPGAPQLFDLVEQAKELAAGMLLERRRRFRRRRDQVAATAAAAAAAEHEAKFGGTPVTADSFRAWAARLAEEMAAVEGLGKVVLEEGPERLTGRQLWERGLAGRGEEEEGASAVQVG